jgi:hypothetical protein
MGQRESILSHEPFSNLSMVFQCRTASVVRANAV